MKYKFIQTCDLSYDRQIFGTSLRAKSADLAGISVKAVDNGKTTYTTISEAAPEKALIGKGQSIRLATGDASMTIGKSCPYGRPRLEGRSCLCGDQRENCGRQDWNTRFPEGNRLGMELHHHLRIISACYSGYFNLSPLPASPHGSGELFQEKQNEQSKRPASPIWI